MGNLAPCPFLKIHGFRSVCWAYHAFRDFFLVLVSIITIIMTISSDKTTSGQVTQYMVFIVVLVALKKNVMEFTLGVSWERAILFHKVFGAISLICASVHGIPQLSSVGGSAINSDTKYLSGLMMLLLLGMQPILYIFIKPYFFEVFYYLHLAIYFTMVYFAIVHGAAFVMYSVILFAIDLCIRAALGSRRVIMKAERKAGDVVQLSFAKKFSYRAGQYVFIMIPALGVHEWHPFSVSSAPHEETMTLHTGVLGDWTRRLAALPQSTQTLSTSQELTTFVEGPYGVPAVNFEDDTYQIVVLISGGIGVTPHQSLANHLLDAHARGKPLKKLIYVWALRDPKMGLVSTMLDNGQFPINRNLELGDRSLKGSSRKADPSANPYLTSPGVLHSELYCTRSAVNPGELPASLMPTSKSLLSEAPTYHGLDPLKPDLEQTVPVHTELKYDRPDFPLIFARVKELAMSLGEHRVAVSVCGPAAMLESATAACRAATTKEVQIDLHVEVFRL